MMNNDFNVTEKHENKKRVFIVVNPIVARGLLKLGYQIVDIKPHKNNPIKTVFVFNDDKNIKKDFYKLHSELHVK